MQNLTRQYLRQFRAITATSKLARSQRSRTHSIWMQKSWTSGKMREEYEKKRGVHPSKDILGREGSELEGKRIVLCITGSVAAYRAIDLARLLMRHDADVHAVMTESTASTLLNPEIMKWATGNDVVTKLTGNLEHIILADYGMSDLIIVYPCTANTLGKM